MSEERKKILKMLNEGTISVEEADELLQTMGNDQIDKELKEGSDLVGGWEFAALGIQFNL